MYRSETDMLELAIAFAVGRHRGQRDKSGNIYVLHPLRVMFAVAPDKTAMTVAALHDVVEDCGVTLEDLRSAGFPENVVTAVDLVSRPLSGTPDRPSYKAFIQRIIDSKNELAVRVKIADTLDNNSPARMDGLPPEQRSIRERYVKTLQMFAEAGY